MPRGETSRLKSDAGEAGQPVSPSADLLAAIVEEASSEILVFDPETLGHLIHSMAGVRPEILYLDCSDGGLQRRYDETRRVHPLAPDRPAEDGRTTTR